MVDVWTLRRYFTELNTGMQAGEMGLNPIDLKQERKQVQERLAADSWVMGESLGYSQVGKAGAFEALILSLVQVQLPQRKENKHLQKMIWKVVDKPKRKF